MATQKTSKRPWLDDKHPLYDLRMVEWQRNERRLRGGTDVLPELRRFDWESAPPNFNLGEYSMTRDAEQLAGLQTNKDVLGRLTRNLPGEHYAQRQSQAQYVNFSDAFLTMLMGHLFRKAPTFEKGLDFGKLGQVRPERAQIQPTNAEVVYYNTDGVGNDGSQWAGFWQEVGKWAGATGHRWIMVEASVLPSVTQADVYKGKRPYLCHLSPLDIPNWDFEEGRLGWCIQHLPYESAALDSAGVLQRDTNGRKRLYIRKGNPTFLTDADVAPLVATGGWITFDAQGEVLVGPGMQGAWDKTDGDIPMWVHYYERDKKRMSRPGISELGNAAVAFMNLDSAATFDAWDAASSLQFLLGVDPASFQVAMDKIQDGSKYIPVPSVGEPGVPRIVPTVQDSSAGAVTATVFTDRMLAIRDTVKEVTGLELTGTPNASGTSKQAGFTDSKAPRLALLASEMETSQNIAIYYLEKRFGVAQPAGAVQWTRDFDLAPVLDSIERLFTLQRLSGLNSPSLSAKMMISAAKEGGMLANAEFLAIVEAEYKTASEAAVVAALRASIINSEFGGDPIAAAGAGPLGTAPSTAPKPAGAITEPVPVTKP